MTAYRVVKSKRYNAWYGTLSEQEQDAVISVLEHLEREGPALRRPLVGNIKQSRHANMKELLVPRANIRMLFAFDPLGIGILLLGGSKTNDWTGWYDENVPIADDIFDEHLERVKAFKAQQEAERKAAEKAEARGKRK